MRVEGQELRSVGRGGLLLVKLALVIAASGLFAYSLSGFAMPNGLPNYENWWLMMVAIGTILAALTFRTDWQTVGIIAATLIIGFSAQLALRTPFWHQHFRFVPSALSYAMVAAIGLQGLVASILLLRWNLPRQALRVFQDLGWIRVAILILILVVASKSPMDFVAKGIPIRFFPHLAVSVLFVAANVLSFVVLIVALPRKGLRKLGDATAAAITFPGGDTGLRRLDWVLPFFVAGFVFALCVAIGVLSFASVPHLDDIVYLFHARYFFDGALTLPLPPSIPPFDHYLMDVYEGRWFSVNFPGWPLALAIAQITGTPWLINPVLAAASVLLLHHFSLRMADRGTANMIVLLMAVSPWYVSISSTGLLHTFTYTLVLAAWVCLIQAQRRPSQALPLLAGALMGWLFLARPLEGLYMGTLTGLWILSFLADRRQWRTVVLYGIGCVAVAALLLPYNAHLTGDPLTTPMSAYVDKIWGPGANALGFGPEIGAPGWGNVDAFEGHSLGEALLNAHQNLYELNSELFGWGGFSLLFALIYFLWGKWTRLSVAMAIVCIVTIFLYSLYWYVGGFYTGPRYWFMTIVPIFLFSVLGFRTTIERMSDLYPDRLSGRRLGAGLAFLGLCSILVFQSWLSFNKFPNINRYHGEYLDLARQDRYRSSLIFIDSDLPNEFGSAFWLNDFAADADTPLFARDLGAEINRIVASSYPERPIYLVNGRSTKQSHVSVTRGPLTLDDLGHD